MISISTFSLLQCFNRSMHKVHDIVFFCQSLQGPQGFTGPPGEPGEAGSAVSIQTKFNRIKYMP